MDLASIIRQQEQDVLSLSTMRMGSMEALALEKDKLLAAERSKFAKLKEDFRFNLALLEDRDKELDAIESKCQEQAHALDASAAELAQLRAALTGSRAEMDAQAREAAARAQSATAEAALLRQSHEAEVAQLSASIAALREEAHASTAALKAHTASRFDLEQQLASCRAEMEQLERHSQAMLQRQETSSGQTLTQLRAAQEAFDRQQRTFEQRLADVTAKKEQGAKSLLAGMQAEFQELDAKFQGSQQTLAALQHHLKQSKLELSSVTKANALQAETDGMMIQELRAELHEAQGHISALVGQLDTTRSELEEASRQLQVSRHEGARAQQRHSISVSQSADEAVSLKTTVGELRSALDLCNTEIASLKSQNSALTEQAGMLTRAIQDGQASIDDLKQKLRETEAVTTELASVKHQLGSTSALLRDARTELRLATIRGQGSTTADVAMFRQEDALMRLPAAEPAFRERHWDGPADAHVPIHSLARSVRTSPSRDAPTAAAGEEVGSRELSALQHQLHSAAEKLKVLSSKHARGSSEGYLPRIQPYDSDSFLHVSRFGLDESLPHPTGPMQTPYVRPVSPEYRPEYFGAHSHSDAHRSTLRDRLSSLGLT